jgi:hypothetical protein
MIPGSVNILCGIFGHCVSGIFFAVDFPEGCRVRRLNDAARCARRQKGVW